MRVRAILPFMLLALPAVAQDLPGITAEETAAAVAAVEAAGLSDAAYRSLWCAGRYDLRHADEVAAAETGAAQLSATTRDGLYRTAAAELLAAGLSESDFITLAENVYRVVLSQLRAADTNARDFADAECTAASMSAPSP